MRHRLVAGLLLVAGAGIIGAVALRPVPPRPIIGMVRATEIKIAPEVSGHIAALQIKAGDPVTAGMVVAQLSNPELDAAVGEAEAAVLEAKAVRDRVYAGIRQEEVDIAAREIEKANADVTLAQQQYRRIESLYPCYGISFIRPKDSALCHAVYQCRDAGTIGKHPCRPGRDQANAKGA